MFSQVEISNYRCLRSVSASLSPLTVVIGPNDSGKTTLLNSLRLLSEPQNSGNASLSSADHWLRNIQNEIRIQGTSTSRTVTFHRNARAEERIEVRPSALPRFSASVFRPPITGVPLQSDGTPDDAGPPPLGASGENTAALLDYLLRTDRTRFDKLVVDACASIPGLTDVRISAPSGSTRRIELAYDNALHLPAKESSTGVGLMIFFLALTYHPSPPDIILIEEPETGLHPIRLGEVMSLLRDISAGLHSGKRAQVVLTTHSPYLIDNVNLDCDQVLVMRREGDGSRTARPVDRERLKDFLGEFMLGEIWYNRQEEGLITPDDAS